MTEDKRDGMAGNQNFAIWPPPLGLYGKLSRGPKLGDTFAVINHPGFTLVTPWMGVNEAVRVSEHYEQPRDPKTPFRGEISLFSPKITFSPRDWVLVATVRHSHHFCRHV